MNINLKLRVTQVLLKAFDFWGVHIVKYVQGMLVFLSMINVITSLYGRGLLWEKPLYILLDNSNFIASSDARAVHYLNKRRLI